MILSALVPTTRARWMPFPSGGKSSVGHFCCLDLALTMVVPNTLDAGSRACLSHMTTYMAG